jgi:DNA-binding Xre family transcriptional regulator
MKWNLRLAAAHRGIWKASEMQRLLAERGLTISTAKMSGLWSGEPPSIKLADLDVICAVLGCDPGEILIPEPDKVPQPVQDDNQITAVGQQGTPELTVEPRTKNGRSLPPR